jgi:hypothetical protein
MGGEQSTAGYYANVPDFRGRVFRQFVPYGRVCDEDAYERRKSPRMAAGTDGFFDIGDGILRNKAVVEWVLLTGYPKHCPRDRFVVVSMGGRPYRSKLLPRSEAEAFKCKLTGAPLPVHVDDDADAGVDAGPPLGVADKGPFCTECWQPMAPAAHGRPAVCTACGLTADEYCVTCPDLDSLRALATKISGLAGVGVGVSTAPAAPVRKSRDRRMTTAHND